jgi:thymidylate synthase
MEKQIPWIIEELRREPYSRRATIMIGSPYDHLLESPACLQTIQYLIRDDKLHCKVLFRSNDAAKATFMNAYALIRLQERIAKTLGAGMGTYTHRANSFHCYGRDYKMLDGYVRRLESGSEVTYNYEGDWDERMEAAKPAIAEKVRKLREEHDLGRLEGLVKG